MNMEHNIFGLRHQSNMYFYPSPDELAAFLAGAPAGTDRRRSSDLAPYRALIDDIRETARLSLQERLQLSIEQKVFSGVLSHTRFASHVLASEIEHYKYFLHMLKAMDPRKPLTFIRSAAEEMKKLDPRKAAHAERQHRLQQLSEARKRDLEGMLQRREALCEELVSIARYVRDNLIKIEHICKTSLAVLSDGEQAGKIENRMTEDVKAHFRNYVKVTLDRRSVTPAFLEELKADVATLDGEIVAFRRDAAAAMKTLYRSLYQHTGYIARGIEAPLAQLGERRCEGDATDQMLFGRIEQQLVRLVADWRLEIRLPERATATPYADVFNDRKREALATLFDLVRGERRAMVNRRSGRDRRLFRPGIPKAVERRSVSDRRSGNDRRLEAPPAY
jgi:hypothetical protein